MKADKILFGITCIGMGVLLNMEINKNTPEPRYTQTPNTTLLGDSVRLRNLGADTLCLSNAVKSDTAKILKMIK